MKKSWQTSKVVEFSAASQWNLLSWLEAVSTNNTSHNQEMDLEDWLAALDADFEFLAERCPSEQLPDNVIDLAAYRERKQYRQLQA